MANKSKGTLFSITARREIGGVLQIIYGPNRQINKIKTILTGISFREKDVWVAYCRELDLSSCGDTFEQARQNLNEAIEGFFEACIKAGTLDQALAELGWKCRTPDNHLVECSELNIPKWTPPAFMIEKMGRGHEWQMQLKLGSTRH
jgi:predicted RNase H-like HicB family nuclease